MYAEYAHRWLHRAVEEFCEGLPAGKETYLNEIREMTLRLYRAHAGNDARYFLDKSPRYHVISSDIMQLFPDAKFVFLWRNPLAIVSSHIETWGGGRWNLYEFVFDLYDGLGALIAARRQAGDRACSIQYEDLVAEAPRTLERLFGQLGLEFDAERAHRFRDVPMAGRMWDPTGTKRYSELSREPLDRWKDSLASPLRKWWCRRYVRWIGRERLQVMGYDMDALLVQLDSIPVRYATLISDTGRMLFGVFVRLLEPWVMRGKFAQIVRGERIRALS